MKTPKLGISRRGLLGASAGLAAGAGLGLPKVTLAGTTTAPPADAAPPASVAAAEAAVAKHSDAILRISREVWALAELSVEEVKSAEVHLRELEAAGFKTTSRGTSGFPAAFVSEWTQGSGGPIVGFLPEYDALPDLGNTADPKQNPTPNGNTNGHGCGHNALGAGCTGAAFALKTMMEAAGTQGTIRVYGCSAEETEGVKVHMARDGLFDDLDAALAWHPAPFAATGEVMTAAIASVLVRFFGRTAHAGNTPWDGRSALKGAELFGAGIQYMREHVPATTRMHYIYEVAGSAPNVTPDFAQIWLQLRAKNRDDLEALVAWTKSVAEGAALMTQTRSEYQIFHGMHDLLPNTPMIGLVQAHMTARPPVWTDAEQTFAKTCQAAMGLTETGLMTSVLAPLPPTHVGGGTDLGDVSKIAPMGVFGWPTVGLGTSLHTWAITACGGMSIGDRASLDTARILAGVGYDMMTDADLRSAAKADLVTRMNGKPYDPILPAEQKGPLRLPVWLHKAAGEEFVSIETAA
jgi:aminobenzoyl-glutamate utilization protein B